MPVVDSQKRARGVPRMVMIVTLGLAILLALITLTYQATRPAGDASVPDRPEPAVNTLEPGDPLDRIRTELAALGERLQRLAQRAGQGSGERRELQKTVAELAARLSARGEQQTERARARDALAERQARLEGALARIENARDPETLKRHAQALTELESQLAQLRAEHQQRFYRVNALDARLRQQVQVLESLRMRVAALPIGGPGPTALTPPPDTLPFSVTAIDRWNGTDTITVAEPALAGRRNTVFLREGDSHLGWTVTGIDGRRVTFTHRSGKTLTATAQG